MIIHVRAKLLENIVELHVFLVRPFNFCSVLVTSNASA